MQSRDCSNQDQCPFPAGGSTLFFYSSGFMYSTALKPSRQEVLAPPHASKSGLSGVLRVVLNIQCIVVNIPSSEPLNWHPLHRLAQNGLVPSRNVFAWDRPGL